MRFITTALSAGSLLATLSIASAHDYKSGDLTIGHPWSRATLPNAPVAGGYMTITNTGNTADRLIGGSSPAAGGVEVHQMSMEGDIMKMRPVEGGLEIKPGETVTLKPGGYHLMLTKPAKRLMEGDHVPLTLTFERAGDLKVDLSVDKPTATGPGGTDKPAAGDMDHGAMGKMK